MHWLAHDNVDCPEFMNRIMKSVVPHAVGKFLRI